METASSFVCCVLLLLLLVSALLQITEQHLVSVCVVIGKETKQQISPSLPITSLSHMHTTDLSQIVTHIYHTCTHTHTHIYYYKKTTSDRAVI